MWTAWTLRFSMHSIYKEEQYLPVHLTLAHREGHARIHDYLIIRIILVLELFACDFNLRVLLRTNLTNQYLVLRRDHLMKREFKFSDKIVTGPSREILKVVDVIDRDFENLLLLELVWHVEALDPLGAEVVHDHLGHANHLPHVASPLVEHAHAVRSRKRVKIWQVFACKGEPKRLAESDSVNGVTGCS